MRNGRPVVAVAKSIEPRTGLILLAVLGLTPGLAPMAQDTGAAAPAPVVDAAAAEATPVHETKCESAVTVSYEQWNTSARVEGTVANATCGASKGDFTLLLSVRDDAGESKVIEAEKTWQREDDQPVAFKAEVPIGNNVELRRVRARSNHCICTDAAAAGG